MEIKAWKNFSTVLLGTVAMSSLVVRLEAVELSSVSFMPNRFSTSSMGSERELGIIKSDSRTTRF